MSLFIFSENLSPLLYCYLIFSSLPTGLWAFKQWCWRRLLRVPWTVRRSNLSILKEISPEYSLEGLMLLLLLNDYVASVVSDSVWPHRQQSTRLHHPWDSPGKNTGVVCHFLLQCMKVKSEREVAQSCLTLHDPTDCSLPGSSVYGIFQARALEWTAIAFSGKDWWWCWNSNTLATWCEELTHWKRPWCWERLKAGGEGDDRGWDSWMASPTRWTWVWVCSGSWWWTGKPGVLKSRGSQRVGHDWVTELHWVFNYVTFCRF